MADGTQTIVTNRRARYDFELGDRFEAGLVLTGSEVKALRTAQANLQDAFVILRKDGVDLVNAYIAPYEMAGRRNHEPSQPRRLTRPGPVTACSVRSTASTVTARRPGGG